MFSTTPPPAGPFDLATHKERISEFARIMLKMMMAPASVIDDEATARSFHERLLCVVTDSMRASSEVQRLYSRFEELQRKHMPLAGEPGAAAVCTGCSLHGVQVPWPCELYAFASKSLPERH